MSKNVLERYLNVRSFYVKLSSLGHIKAIIEFQKNSSECFIILWNIFTYICVNVVIQTVKSITKIKTKTSLVYYRKFSLLEHLYNGIEMRKYNLLIYFATN